MEEKINEKKQEDSFDTGLIHFSLSFSYLMFLFAVILGVIFDLIIPIKILDGTTFQYVGIIMIIIGSFFAYWAQSTSRRKKGYTIKERNVSDFKRGPYKYLRSPTHFGLLIMTLGLGVIINSPFSILFIVVGHILSKFIFLKKEESLLEKKYGQVYTEYKEKVKNWI